MRGVHCLTPEKRSSVEDKKCTTSRASGEKTFTGNFQSYSMIVEGIVSARVMKYGRRNSEEEEEELHVAKRGKKKGIVLLVLR